MLNMKVKVGCHEYARLLEGGFLNIFAQKTHSTSTIAGCIQMLLGANCTDRCDGEENLSLGVKTVLDCTGHDYPLSCHLCRPSFWSQPKVLIWTCTGCASHSGKSSNLILSSREGPYKQGNSKPSAERFCVVYALSGLVFARQMWPAAFRQE